MEDIAVPERPGDLAYGHIAIAKQLLGALDPYSDAERLGAHSGGFHEQAGEMIDGIRSAIREFFDGKELARVFADVSHDVRYLALMTRDYEGGSAILRAETATGDLTVVDATQPGAAVHFEEGNDLTVWRQTGLIVTKLANVALLAYDVNTLEKRVLIDRFEPDYSYGHPAGSPDGRHLFIAKHHLPKDETTHTIYLRIDLATGKVEELFRDERSANVHILAHPSDPDLLLIDRNYAPRYHAGSDGKTTRA